MQLWGKIKHCGFNQQIKVARTRLPSRWAFPSYWENAVILWVIGLHNQRLYGDVSTQPSLMLVHQPMARFTIQSRSGFLFFLMEFSYDHAIQQEHQGQLAYIASQLQPAHACINRIFFFFLQFSRVMKRGYVYNMYLESDFYS